LIPIQGIGGIGSREVPIPVLSFNTNDNSLKVWYWLQKDF